MFKKIFLTLLTGTIAATLCSCEDKKKDDTSLLFLLLGSASGAIGTAPSCKDASFCRTFIATNNGAGYNGNLGGIAGADAKCMAARPSGLNGTYKALLVSFNVREVVFAGDGSPGLIDWVLYPNKQYRRSDGTTVTFTTNANSTVTANLANGIDAGAQKFFWNGFNGGPGTFPWEVASDCNAWASNDGNNAGQAGNTTSTNPNDVPGGAFTVDTWNCNANLNLLCVEQ
ncbi:DUF1554 domain-containing protein [Leptospira sp. FAT2]|uniref:endostatin-like outer membrane protein, LenA/LenB family n=1 Tax=Leptospira sanjuanensis TaxID=2879643 RepID=UPI001EE8F3D7|nr:DUF1554 domain-containing protein [Leptospira sanjuanensis]MCG6168619.1 DUF1554 domain-containing protein [Leptospira sanjuanensis]MCG6194037.1 DUF1554 domain-containing protein [Leptospira sanjuanensis]